jgi:hypothetical protein
MALRTWIRQQRSVLSAADKLKIATKRQNLDIRLDSFIANAEQFVNNDTLDALQKLNDSPPAPVPPSQAPDYQTNSDDDDPSNPFITRPPVAAVHTAETRPLPLPSTFGFPQITLLGLDSLAEKELKLREGQANDELQGVRMALGEKSFLFRKNLRLATSKNKKGRAWSKVHAISRRVQAHRQVYNTARAAMVSLGCSAEMQSKYQVLRRDQLKISTAAVRGGTGTGNAEGGSRRQDEPLAWFWTINVQADVEASEMMKECMYTSIHFTEQLHCYLVYRVHWLRANAKHDRWSEELSITTHEMAWIPRYFLHRAEAWIGRLESEKLPGAVAYIKRQAANWRQMAASSVRIFKAINPRVGNVWGFE